MKRRTRDVNMVVNVKTILSYVNEKKKDFSNLLNLQQIQQIFFL